jgi:glycosyltransferase involved in cell wall biosynthesis
MTYKACILTTVHPPFATRIFHKEAKTLVKAGYDVTLIVQHDRDEVVDGVRIMALARPPNRFARIFSLTWRAFWLALRQHADIYHFHDPELLPWGWLLQKITHKPVIYDVHEYYSENILTKQWIPALLRRPISKIVDRGEKMIAKRLAGVITVNQHMEDLFKGLNKNTIIAHNYPFRSFVERLNDKPLADSFTVIYVGSVSKDRGYRIMVNAMQIVKEKEPRARCNIVGSLNRAGLQRDFLSEEDILLRNGGIELVGRVPYGEIPRFLLESSIGWFPLFPTLNYLKSTPIKLFEYMAARLPIVASDMGSIRGIIEDNNCGLLVNPRNSKAHAEAILYFFEHPEEARRMGENGRRAVLEKYNWENEEKELLKLYEVLLGQ